MSVFFHIKANCDVEPDKYPRLQMRSGEIWFCRHDNIHTGKTFMTMDYVLKNAILEVLLLSVYTEAYFLKPL